MHGRAGLSNANLHHHDFSINLGDVRPPPSNSFCRLLATPASIMASPAVEPAYNRGDEHNTFLPRSASYNHLPDAPPSEPGSPGLRRTLSDLTYPTQPGSPSKADVAAGKDILRRTSRRSKDRPSIAAPRFTLSAEKLGDAANSNSPDVNVRVPETRAPEPVARPSKTRSMSGRLASIARKPWISNAEARPPSPLSRSGKTWSLRGEDSILPISLPSTPSKAARAESVAESDTSLPSRKKTMLNKRPRRPRIAVLAKGQDDSLSSPSSPQFPRSQDSLESLTSSLNVSTPILPTTPKAAAKSATSVSNSVDSSRKRDELWGAFRDLEADYQR